MDTWWLEGRNATIPVTVAVYTAPVSQSTVKQDDLVVPSNSSTGMHRNSCRFLILLQALRYLLFAERHGFPMSVHLKSGGIAYIKQQTWLGRTTSPTNVQTFISPCGFCCLKWNTAGIGRGLELVRVSVQYLVSVHKIYVFSCKISHTISL